MVDVSSVPYRTYCLSLVLDRVRTWYGVGTDSVTNDRFKDMHTQGCIRKR